MAKYRAYGHVVGGKYLGVIEAASKEEAKEKALEMDTAYVSLCHQCTDECEDPQIEDVTVEPCDDDESDE